MISLGIDPGLTGGIALVEQEGDRRRVLLAVDIPTFGEDAKRRVNVLAVLRRLQSFKITAGFIERAQAMPDQGASSGFIYGRATGALEACILGLGVPMRVIESSAWKKEHGLIRPKDIDSDAWKKVVKEKSRQRALFLHPECRDMMPLKQDHGRAEAVLIADHGLTLLQPRPDRNPPPRRKKSVPQLDLLDEASDSA